MGEGGSRDCISWEEEIYWTHFQYIHFSQFLHAGFDQRLALPEKFSRNLKSKLPDTVTLKGPCGASWEVSLTANENTLFFDHIGWQEFVKDHSLQENDILVFKYNGESRFDVLVFNGQSMCENAASYFLRKFSHEQHGSGCQTKRKTSQSSTEFAIASPENGIEGSLSKKPTNKEIYNTPIKQSVTSQSVHTKARREINFKSKSPISTKKSAGIKEPNTCAGDVGVKPEIDYTSINLSNGRRITKQDKQRALQLAQAVLTNEGFIAVMRPTYVSKKFFVNIPYAWISKHLTSREKQDVTLRIEEKTWGARLLCYRKDRNRIRGGLAGGWKNFVLDNKLNEFDVCVFEPGSLADNSIVLDVNIFRVV